MPSWMKNIEFSDIVDINSAEIEELISLPDTRKKTAENIIYKRNKLGRYNSVEDIMLVPGIWSKTYENISPLIRIN